MPIRAFKDKTPRIDPSAYVDEMAVVIGDVVIGADSSIWPMCSVRGDVNYIRIGARTNIQDGTVIHGTSPHPGAPNGVPTVLGDDVTIGHQCILHACTIESGCLIGMGSTILDRVVVRQGVLLGAGSLVTEGKELEGGYLWAGRPAKRVRALSAEERTMFVRFGEHYARLKAHYQNK